MVPPQSMPGETTQPIHGPGERTSPNPNPESMHIERDFRLTMNQESIHALAVRIHNLDRGLPLYPIAKMSELMPYCLLPRKG